MSARATYRALLLAGALAALAGCARTRTESAAPKVTADTEWRMRAHERIAVDAGDTSRVLIEYPEFTRATSRAALDSLNAWVRESVLKPFDADSVAPDTNVVMDGFLSAWLEARRDVGTSLAWRLERAAEVVGDTLGTISMRWLEIAFTGGAHPNSQVELVVFDAASGERLEFGDVFRVAARESLNAAADPLFRRGREISPTADLAAEGFEFPNGRFRLNERFSVAGDGVTFFFNSYEIAPYVMGPTEVVIPWSIARPFLREDSPVGRGLR